MPSARCSSGSPKPSASPRCKQQRNEIGDLQSRVDAIRGQQQALKERLAPVLENRRAIERLFLELDTSQNDVERALAEIASGDDATALDLRLKKLTEFVRQCHERCDDIETASKTVASLKEAYAELHTRLAPFAAAKGGVTDRVKELSEARDVLAADIDTLAAHAARPARRAGEGISPTTKRGSTTAWRNSTCNSPSSPRCTMTSTG